MGYYTAFSIEIYGKDYCPSVDEKIRKAFAKVQPGYFEYMINHDYTSVADYFDSMDTIKWYEFDTDMIKISEMFPTLTFKLHGDGEEAGDIWEAYFKNGKMQMCRAEIVIPAPNDYFLED